MPQRLSSPRILHHVAALLSLDNRRLNDGAVLSSVQRRQRQQRALAQRLLDPLPAKLRLPELKRERFWLILRWGGAGLLAGWVLAGPVKKDEGREYPVSMNVGYSQNNQLL